MRRQICCCLRMVANFTASNGSGQASQRGQTVAGTLAKCINRLLHYVSDHGSYQISVAARMPRGWQCPG